MLVNFDPSGLGKTWHLSLGIAGREALTLLAYISSDDGRRFQVYDSSASYLGPEYIYSGHGRSG